MIVRLLKQIKKIFLLLITCFLTLKKISLLDEQLKKLRKEISTREKDSSFIVFNDKSLEEMALKKPQNEENFLAINGVGQRKFGLSNEATRIDALGIDN